MSIDTAAGAAPIFMGLPLITKDADTAGDLVCSDATMQSLRNRLYQLDPTAPCASVGSVGTETITAGFWLGSAQVSKSVDCFFILNMTLLKFKLEYSNDNGATWTLVPGSDYSSVAYAGGADYVLFLASPVTANKVRLTMYDLTDKSIGTFDCAKVTFQSSRPFTSLDDRHLQTRKEIILADGTRDYTYFQWSDNSYSLHEVTAVHDYSPSSDKTLFDTLFEQTDPFLFYVEPGDSVRSIYLSALKVGTYQSNYVTSWKGRGYRIQYTTEPLGYV